MTDYAGEHLQFLHFCEVSTRRRLNFQGLMKPKEQCQPPRDQSLSCNTKPLERVNRRINIRPGIEQVVSRVFGVARGDLRRATRGRAKVALARQVAMYLAHVVFGLSLTEVGRAFERDRTTVSHACGVVEDRRDDPTFDRVLENLERIIEAWPSTRDLLHKLR